MQTHRYIFPDGIERVLHDVTASEALPALIDGLNHRRVFIVCSRTIRRETDIVIRIQAALGDRVVGLSDKVGEHSPIGNVLLAAASVRDAGADALVTIGGGSVLDFGKFIQLAVSEHAFDREALLRFPWKMSADGTEFLSTSSASPALRQIAVPTTLATAEWTSAGTPIDETTRQKARLAIPRGVPQAIVYDPDILGQTPRRLLMSTGIRGLDHAINTLCAQAPNPFTSLLAEKAIALFVENLPRIYSDRGDRQALSNCQFATWCCGMGQMSMSALHGFSHFMVHVIAPYASIAHSDAACVMMLAQARWIEEGGGGHHDGIKHLLAIGNESFADVLEKLLEQLDLPTTLTELGIIDDHLDEVAALAAAHPLVTKYNIRPVNTAIDIRYILNLVK